MSLISVRFFLFLVLALIGYYTFASNYQRLWLLGISLYYYASFEPRALFFLLFCAFSTFFAAKYISSSKSKRLQTLVLHSVIVSNIGLLLFIKLFNYYGNLLVRVIKSTTTMPFEFHTLNLLVPLGVSYFTLQAVSYVIDVNRKKITAEDSLLTYLLFISYFPLITQGPIARYNQMKNQLCEYHSFSYKNITHGAQLAVWGVFKKLVIADRLGIAVTDIFSNPRSGSVVIFGAFLFSIQLYADFSGCMDLVSGYSEMFGITLPVNFSFPFSATSIKDFWSRWHISLGSWLRDYVYIPLGGSRKGKIRRFFNILITFFVSGIWHGGTLGYLMWGILHGLYQILEDLLLPLKEKSIRFFRVNKESDGFHIIERIVTFFLVSFAWIFFRADGAAAALHMIKLLVTDFRLWTLFQNIYSFGLSEIYTWFLFVAVATMFLVENVHKRIHVRDYIDLQPLPVRWFIYMSAVVVVILTGNYGVDGTSMFRYAYF